MVVVKNRNIWFELIAILFFLSLFLCFIAKMLKAMSIDGFLMYLASAEGSIFHPRQQSLYQDMTQPLNHYFISSSHNTYLMEDQLLGHSSVEGYIRYVHYASGGGWEGLVGCS